MKRSTKILSILIIFFLIIASVIIARTMIGRWSAEMILLFTYNRSNIWPIQDIGLLRAISKNYKKKYLPPEKFVNLLKKRYTPYCSVATWYLWRSIDPEPIQY